MRYKQLLSRNHRGDLLHFKRKIVSILDREKAITDRTGNPFSFIIYTISEIKGNYHNIIKLSNILKKRKRFIDELCWLGSDSIGLILPNTNFEGAYVQIRDIHNLLGANGFHFSTQIFVYPDSWFSSHKTLLDKIQSHSLPANTVVTSYELMDVKKISKDKNDYIHVFLLHHPLPFWKRSIDIFGASLTLVLLAPLFLVIGVYIKSVSPGPVFFKQERIGYMGNPYICWKFRTMRTDMDQEQHRQHVCNLIHNGGEWKKLEDLSDSWIIPWGRMLRKLGIDELPQLFNVLRGEMSLVGPRPCMPYEASEFLNWQNRRFESFPGLTGLWQVNGKNKTSFNQMMKYDVTYAKTISFWMDCKILLRTIPALIKQAKEKRQEVKP